MAEIQRVSNSTFSSSARTVSSSAGWVPGVVTAAALTVYDMCKAVQRDIVIDDIRLLRKSGGVSGDFERED